MKKVTFKTDIKFKDAVKNRVVIGSKKRVSKYDSIPVGAYIQTTKKNHSTVYSALWGYGKKTGKKFSSVTDTSGVSRIFRIL